MSKKAYSALLALSNQLEEKSAGLALECLYAATLLDNLSDEEKAESNYLLGELLLKTAEDPADAKQFFLASIDASQDEKSDRHFLLKSFEKLSTLLPISESIELMKNQLLKHKELEDEILLAKLFFKFIEFFAECGSDRLEQVLSLFSCEAIENLRKKSEYFDILLTLSKALLILKNYCRAYEKLFNELLDETENKLKTTTIEQSRKAPMKIYLHCLRIINVLTWGIPDQSDRKTGKSLKQFHQEIIAFSQLEDAKIPETELDSFFWLKKEELTALGYLITVIHSVNYGNIDKAIKYSERTINQVSLHKSSFNENLRVVTLEYLAQCKLIIGDPLETVKIIGQLCSSVQNSQNKSKISQLHSLIGFLAMNLRRKETALRHFELALESNPENKIYAQFCISLAKGAPLESGFSCDENIPLKAISFLISGYSQFNQRDFDSAKRTLRDGVKISNAQDLKSLTAMFLLLLGEIFISASSDGYVTTVKQARQMATKIQHESSLIWANKLSCSVQNSNEEDLPKIKEELAKLEAKIKADDEAIKTSTLAQTLFDWTSITELPNLAIKEENKPAPVISEKSSTEKVAPAPAVQPQNHALVDQEIDNMISKMEGGSAMMGPPIEKPPPSQSPQSISPRPVASPRPPPVVSPNLYGSQPVNSPVNSQQQQQQQFNTQVPSPLSQPTTPQQVHSPFQQVHSPMNPNPASSPHQHQQQHQHQGMMQQPHFQNNHNSPSISSHHPTPSISPNMPNLQQNLPQNVPPKQHMNVPAQNLNTGFSGAAQHNFGNGHLQSHPNPMQQVPMTQQNYNPFSHTNMMSAAQPNGGGQQLAQAHGHAHVGNGHAHAMPIPGHPQQAAFYPNMFPKNAPNAPTNFPNHFQ